MNKHSVDSFFALIRAGLWEKEALLPNVEVDFKEVYRLAEEQSVVGIVAAGLEHLKTLEVPKEVKFAFVSTVVQLEQCNAEMNAFIEELNEKMHKEGIKALLVKGQGIAQCYERPLWRSPGDVDLLLDDDNYELANQWLPTIGQVTAEEITSKKHSTYKVDEWDVELHGTLRGRVSSRSDKVIDEVQKDTFKHGKVRCWRNGNTDVLIPAPDNDVIFVFTHILQHFFRGGIGLRQICDWCRLLWTYQSEIDTALLESRLQKMDLMSEWRSFAALAVNWLGMHIESMPLYSSQEVYQRKANKIRDIILETGNFGFNRDMSFYKKYPYIMSKFISLYRKSCDLTAQLKIFPKNACCAYWGTWRWGLDIVANHFMKKGE